MKRKNIKILPSKTLSGNPSYNMVKKIYIVQAAILLGRNTTSCLPEEHVIKDPEKQKEFVLGMNITFLFLGVLSIIAGIVHWKVNVRKLYMEPEKVEPL